jgi:hypothetical protein
MCCFLALLLLAGPRVGFIIFWLIPYGNAMVNNAFRTIVWPIIGLIFAPWATLVYTLVFPVADLDWIWIGLAAMVDIASYVGGATRRHDVSYYNGP